MVQKSTQAPKTREELNPYRILSLDGGGIRGLLTATWLSHLEKRLDRSIVEYFDLIAGTSTGSILACGLTLGVSLDKIIKLYVDRGRNVFPGTAKRRWNRISRIFEEGVSGPKYDGKGLEEELKRVFGDATLDQLQKDTLITAYDCLNRSTLVFKSWHGKYRGIPIWQAVKASSSAPTYFPGQVVKVDNAELPLIDGGVTANNPVACAIAEGVRINQQRPAESRVPLQHFLVASFGTGEATRPIDAEDVREWGALEWAIPIIGVLFDGSSNAASYVAEQLIQPGSYYRFQTPLDKAFDDMDDASKTNINALLAIADNYANSREGTKNFAELARALQATAC